MDEEHIDDNISCQNDGLIGNSDGPSSSSENTSQLAKTVDNTNNGGQEVISTMNLGVASQNSEHVYDLSSQFTQPLENRSLRDVFNDVVSFYDKSKNKIQMVVASMAIQMRDLVVEGAKNHFYLTLMLQSMRTM